MGASRVEKFSTWMHGAERLLEALPGVLSASLEGDLANAPEVRLLVEGDPPVSETLEAVRTALQANADEPALGALFRIQVTSVGDGSLQVRDEPHEDPVTATPDTPETGGFRLIAHQVHDVSPGVVGVELTLSVGGRRYAGGASGKANSPGSDRLPALATLSAVGSYIRFASEGGDGPTLALESVSEFSLGGSRVAVVVVVTMSEHAVPLIAAWPLTGDSGPAVVRATLEATARRVTRLSMKGGRPAWEATELIESGGGADPRAILRERGESLLESARAIASARIVVDSVEGLRIHVLATEGMPREEISRMVKTLLEEGIGLRVRLDQITVAQSRLSAEELIHDRLSERANRGVEPDHLPGARAGHRNANRPADADGDRQHRAGRPGDRVPQGWQRVLRGASIRPGGRTDQGGHRVLPRHPEGSREPPVGWGFHLAGGPQRKSLGGHRQPGTRSQRVVADQGPAIRRARQSTHRHHRARSLRGRLERPVALDDEEW